MSKRTAEILLQDMQIALKRVLHYTKGIHYEEFEEDSMRVDAVVRNLEIVGEAARRLAAPKSRTVLSGRVNQSENVTAAPEYGHSGTLLLTCSSKCGATCSSKTQLLASVVINSSVSTLLMQKSSCQLRYLKFQIHQRRRLRVFHTFCTCLLSEGCFRGQNNLPYRKWGRYKFPVNAFY